MKYLAISCCFFMLMGCRADVQFITYPRPDLRVDYSVFESAGCIVDGLRLFCEESDSVSELGCDEIEQNPLYGGLDPAYPIAMCLFDDELSAGKDSFFHVGGFLSMKSVQYVVYENGRFSLIANIQTLQSLFAPIETEQEALSYALVTNDLTPYFSFYHDPTYRYLVDRIEGTHVERYGDDFLVHTFEADVPGCGEYHAAAAVDILITRSGQVEILSQLDVFQNPLFDDMCAD